ncbi:MAG: UDP-N-acetylmuramate dehydrogenase [Chitinophagales bacterium]|nr:UDP-N-acetylmuramate dehydrogenase [Chitinophagales bacterium]
MFTQNFDGLILLNNLKGIEKIEETENHVLVQAMSGEVWHNFVLKTLDWNVGGLENLSLIPGKVGASPMQNIGAYGVEIKDVFHSLQAWNIEKEQIETFYLDDCEFGYRESVFKRKLKDKYLIISVTYKLNKHPKINTQYGDIEKTLEQMGITNPSIQDVSKAVIAIRSSKLPNPAEIGNAGSFFKNPVVKKEQADALKKQYENMPMYTVSDTETKIPAGWLIEQARWKGKRFDNYGVHAKQALVLVNYGGAKGNEIKKFSSKNSS